jgi:hypothetical protein
LLIYTVRAGIPIPVFFYARLALTAAQQNNYPKGIAAASELLATMYEPIDEHEAFKYYKTSNRK